MERWQQLRLGGKGKGGSTLFDFPTLSRLGLRPEIFES